MKTPHSEETIEELIQKHEIHVKSWYKPWMKPVLNNVMKDYGDYIFLQGIEAAKKVVSNEKGQHQYAQGQVSAILSNLEALTNNE